MPSDFSQNVLSSLCERLPSPITLTPPRFPRCHAPAKAGNTKPKFRSKKTTHPSQTQQKPEIPALKYSAQKNQTHIPKSPTFAQKKLTLTTRKDAPPSLTGQGPFESQDLCPPTAPSIPNGNCDARLGLNTMPVQFPPLSQSFESFGNRTDRFQSQSHSSNPPMQSSPPGNAESMEINKTIVQVSHDIERIVGYVDGSTLCTDEVKQSIFVKIKEQQKLMHQISQTFDSLKKFKKERRAERNKIHKFDRKVCVRKNSVYLCASAQTSSWKRWLEAE